MSADDRARLRDELERQGIDPDEHFAALAAQAPPVPTAAADLLARLCCPPATNHTGSEAS